MWLTRLQIAIIEKNTEELEKLLDETPEFKNMAEVESAMYLLGEAKVLLESLKDETLLAMKQLKKNINYLKSTNFNNTTQLDVIY